MKNIILLIITISTILFSCSFDEQEKHSSDESYINYLLRFKKENDSTMVDNFPTKINSIEYFIAKKNDVEKNDVGLILFQFDLGTNFIDSLKNSLKNKKLVGYYKSSDTCLIVINKYETTESYNNNTIPAIKDSSTINRPCYDEKYPIPNFIDYNANYYSSTDLKLDNTFELFIIETNNEKNEKYDLKPNFQMPKMWKNGYSKGIAISQANKTVIYWSVIW